VSRFRPGLDALAHSRRGWLRNARFGLVTHLAAVDGQGRHAADVLAALPDARLAALFGPEHGFFGHAAAGADVPAARHPNLGVPVHSLYGDTRKPTALMLHGLDALVFDMQDLGARPYTYVSTLRLVMETAAERGLPLIVADRPVPLPNVSDGPLVREPFASFVAAIPAPMSYGMTPGETARWLRRRLNLSLDLRVARMAGYRRPPARQPDWPPWIPPSPAIQSWESAACFPATVFAEAFGDLDHGRGTGLAFQIVGAPWLTSHRLLRRLARHATPGALFHPHAYVAQTGALAGQLVQGVRLVVRDPDAFRPIRTAVTLVAALQDLRGDALWSGPAARPDWFDKLFGTDAVRRSLLAGEPPGAIAHAWDGDLRAFAAERRAALLYPEP
jgi:uncharacterized protein YbbC (DUF1343 family)